MYRIVEYAIYLISFALSFYCLMGVDFARFMRKGHSKKAEGLVFILDIALAYLVTQFFLKISNI